MLHLLKCHNKITEGFVSKIIFISQWRCPQGQHQNDKQFQSSDLFVKIEPKTFFDLKFRKELELDISLPLTQYVTMLTLEIWN